jgi:hypothetical protein
MRDISEIIAELQTLGTQANREGMVRFGIKTERAFGVLMKERLLIEKLLFLLLLFFSRLMTRSFPRWEYRFPGLV